MSEAIVAQCSPPPSEPANKAFFLFKAMGRMLRSTILESISMLAIVDEARQAFPAGQHVTDRFGELCFLADESELCAQPRLQRINERLAFMAANTAPLIGVEAPDGFLDLVEHADAFQRFAGDRRRARGGEFVKATAHMRPTECEFDVAALGQRAIADIAVDLQHALEAGEMRDGRSALRSGAYHIGDAGRIGAAPGPVVPGVSP